MTVALCVAGSVAVGQTPFEGWGRVIALDAAKGSVTLDHEPIPDLMPAQRSEFPVQRADLLRDAKIGDMVRFALVVSDQSHGILIVSRLEPRLPDREPPRLRGSLLDAPLWLVVPGILALLLAGIGGVAYALWRSFRGLRRDLAVAVEVQRSLRRDVRAITEAFAEIVTMLRDRRLADVRRRIAAIEAPSGESGREARAARSLPGSLVVVRQGETALFRSWQDHPMAVGVQVIWDRRVGQRRSRCDEVTVERRRGERRQPPPNTWHERGFVLATERGRIVARSA